MEDVYNMPTRVTLTVDLDADGKHHGYACVPLSVDESAWGQVQLPLTVIKNGSGPTVLFTGGNHGDEYEGPIAQLQLAHTLKAEDIRGRVIICPCMNLPAVQAGTRTSPLDGGNLNRVFPGHPAGNITQQIAHFVVRELVARADVVVDMHSGGKTLDIVPSAVMHRTSNAEQMETTRAALMAFGAPVAMVLDEDTTGMLDAEVERLGKTFISTELGGMGTVTAERVDITAMGIRNILAHFKLTKDAVVSPSKPVRLLENLSRDLIHAEHAGLYEPLVDLGAEVKQGQPIAHIWDYQTAGCAPIIYYATCSGMVYVRHAPGLISRGDTLALVAAEA